MAVSTKSGATWRNRIVEQGPMPVAELVANRQNWRRYPDRQASALGQVLETVGLVQGVVLNRRSESQGWPPGEVPTLVDGHLRVELARKRGELDLPVTTVDLSPEEERLVLATLDPLGALAETDADVLEALCADLPDVGGELQGLLEELASAGKVPDFQPVGEDEQGRLDQKKPVTCPSCGHEFTT